VAQRLRRRIAAVNESSGATEPYVASTAPLRVLMTRTGFLLAAHLPWYEG